MLKVADEDELSEYRVDGVNIGDHHAAMMQKRNESW
ncbi:hypothetical protein J2Z69_000719 [Paenibacillus shirakamiensis]|uniref:Uncharacterized protein n=1 Tax=Paenibacillus shirakamiensis TaxID=1265935 RepID=A0ABS4JD99_9BACL|nr:hypothetical protein [Paenibacillus shirakamiensis]